MPELYSHPREDGREHVACVRDERVQADVPRLRGARRQLHDTEGEGWAGNVPLRPEAQQHLRIRGRGALHGHCGRFRGDGPDHLQGAAPNRAVRLQEPKR